MVSKKLLAIFLVIAIIVSLIGTAVVLVNLTEEKTEGSANVKLFVEDKKPQPTGMVQLNVVEKAR